MEIKEKFTKLRQVLQIDAKLDQIKKIEAEMQKPDFWLDEKKSLALTRELKKLQNETSQYLDLAEIVEIATDEELENLAPEIEKLEKTTLFDGKYDNHNVIINFYAGAGGVDAQDWTEMLLKMYLRFAEKKDAKTTIIEETKGAEAGIKSATIEIEMPYAYGNLKYESGVHRLVRQSPFNAKNLRQTSFALVSVMPAIELDSEMEIDQKDLRVDVYRAGGHGGQSVNTTDSAVRITHIPTNIVVTCQNERSQLQNKETALKVLRSKLAQLLVDQHKEKIDELRGDFASPEWGNQIRSYVLHPYKMVKDHRTEAESSNHEAILAGDLDQFIDAEISKLKSGDKIV